MESPLQRKADETRVVTAGPLYVPLYDTLNGGGSRGFACNVQERIGVMYKPACCKVTRTERGMLMHLLRVHGLRNQQELFKEAK